MKGKISLLLLLRITLYFMDIISDIYVAIQYYKNGENWWCRITLVFVLVPHFIINTYVACTNVLFLGLTQRQSLLLWIFQVPILASFKQEFLRWNRQRKGEGSLTIEADIGATMHHTFICVAEAFAESAPQWCLQNYIMIKQWHFPWYTVTSSFLSLLSLAWSITSLETSRKAFDWVTDTNTASVESFKMKSLAVFLASHLCLLISRLTSLVIFAYVFRYYVSGVLSVHWLLSFITICTCEDFSRPSEIYIISKKVKSRIVIVFGILLITALRAYPMVFYLSSSISEITFPRKIRKRFRTFVSVFYVILLLENAVMVLLAINSEAAHMNILRKIVIPLVFAGFTLGVLFLVLYYRCCHPSVIRNEHVQSTNTDALVLKGGEQKEVPQLSTIEEG